MSRALWLSLLLIPACSVEEEEFYSEFPAAICERSSACLDEALDGPGEAPGLGDLCEEEWASTLDSISADESCEFDGNQGMQCLDAVTEGTCEERTAVYYECKRVFRNEEGSCELDVSGML